jgi:oligosaccharide repeat unit polymerase
MLQNSKEIFLCVVGILLLYVVNVFIYNHYSSFLPPHHNLGMMMLLFNLGIVLVAISIYYYQELINPFAFVGLFIIQWGISWLRISNRQHELSSLGLGIIIVTIICFCSGILLSNRYYFRKRILLNQRVQYYLFLTLFYLGVLVFFMEIKKVGYFPFISILQSRNPAAYNSINDSLIPLLHYLVMFHSVLPVLAIILYKRNTLSKVSLFLFIGISVFITLNYLSRQSLLLIALSLFLYNNYHKKINIFKVILSVGALVYLFGLFGTMRSHTITVEDTNKFLKFYSDIDLNTTLFDTYLTLYSSLNFETFNVMVNTAYDQSYFGMGIYSFKPIISLTFMDRVGLVSYPHQFDSFTKLATFIADPFLDFGWIGVVFMNLLYGWVTGIIFNSYEQRLGVISIMSWTVVTFCLIMLPFANYFDNFMVWLFLIIINLFAGDENFSLHSNI